MRLLLNECIVGPITIFLKELNYDVVHIDELGLKGQSDEENSNLAIQQERILVTQDRDFAKWRFVPSQTHPGIVYLRMNHKYLDRIKNVLQIFFSNITEASLQNSVATVRFDNYEIRTLNESPILVPFPK